MSVAFRRESDEEHKEPRFELPIPAGPNLVTARGLVLTQAKVAELEALLATPLDADQTEVAKRTLRYWHTRQATAELAPAPPADMVAFGSRVTLRLNDVTRMIDIVGDDEADPTAGHIAFTAPLARAVMGGMAGDMLDFAGRAEAIEIITVAPIPD